MKQSGSYSALQSFGYGLAIVATTIISFAAAAANFLLIWAAPLAFATHPDDLMRIMIFWVFMIGPPVAFVLSLYLLIKYFFRQRYSRKKTPKPNICLMASKTSFP